MNKVLVAIAVVLAVGATSTFAGEDGQLSSSDLAMYGLSSLQPVSDVDGLEVRGMISFASVSGSSWQNFFGLAGGTQSYSAGSGNFGSSMAEGSSFGIAGGFVDLGFAGGIGAVGSFGSSSAYAD